MLLVLSTSYADAQQQQQQQQQPRPGPVRRPNTYVELDEQTRKAENKILLEMFKDLRVADVRDGMDWIGYFGFGSICKSVRPLWRVSGETKPVVGIARTARYLPYAGPYPEERGDPYTRWQSRYYGTVNPYPWLNEIEDGDFLAIDVSGVDAGLMGSENTLRCLMRGARGFVFNGGGMRDTDEVIMQRIPSWGFFISQSMVQARIQYDTKDVPIAIGGVVIYPGDIIIADNDGVIVVPRPVAYEVYKYAMIGLQADIQTRRRLYEQLGWEFDESVEPVPIPVPLDR